ncbi:hypothetical protein [Methylopila sp. M107]|nr:hypothetical protein [Methylopila sp. M107]
MSGDIFWIFMATTGLLVVGGGLAVALARGSGPDDSRDAGR